MFRGIDCVNAHCGEGAETNDGADGSSEVLQGFRDYQVVRRCLSRIQRWKVPRGWSRRDWQEEMDAEMVLSAIEATKKFDRSRGVPWEAFLYQRILHSALARYRREWSHAIRRSSDTSLDPRLEAEREEGPSQEPIVTVLFDLLRQLPGSDRSLIESIYWEGKSEASLGRCLGISQQAVSRRKLSILRSLRAPIERVATIPLHTRPNTRPSRKLGAGDNVDETVQNARR